MKRDILYIFAAAAALSITIACEPDETVTERTEAKPEVNSELWQDEVSVNILTDVQEENYYKDVIMDGGTSLTSRVRLPSCEAYNISLEYWNAEPNRADSLLQIEMFDGNEMDHNGLLLFPDGAPRYKVFYSCGGDSKAHGKYLGPLGRNAVRTFNHNGGSYQGSCAGAFLGSAKRGGSNMDQYYGVWPGNATPSGLSKSATGMFVDEGSPLLKYFDFGGDHYIDSVRHNGGCFCYVDSLFPEKGEILARYDLTGLQTKVDFNDTPVIWSIKEKEEWGRVVSCGSHPEGVTSGDRLHLYSAMALYAMEGNAPARVKGELTIGEERRMAKSTGDADPAFTKIGDKQYHHFTVEVPKDVDTLKVSLKSVKGYTNYDLYLFVSEDDMAFKENAKWQDISLGVDKEIVIKAPKAGKYYISVFCNTTVDTIETAYGTQYTGRVDVLNGVPYIVGVNLPVGEKK